MRTPSAATAPPTAVLASSLLDWYRVHRRALPWRRDRDPYHVWVAEVLLQQTRVAQAAPYFERFLRAFPTVEDLAHAPVDRVLKVWEGAGYYARGHRLHEAARQIVRDRGGRFPEMSAELETLPGVGPYIARAVASIAFGQPEVALEANGLRVAARWTLERGDVRERHVRARLEGALRSILPATRPGEFNEAVMELGETVCRPTHPLCSVCPVSGGCRAQLELADPGTIPIRAGGRRRPHLTAAVAVLEDRGRWLVQRRAASGLLPGLWEFPGGKVEPGERPEAAARRELREETGVHVRRLFRIGIVRHAYSHFTVELHAFVGHPGRTERRERSARRRWVTRTELGRLALPKATQKVVALLDAEGAIPGSGSPRGRARASRTPRGRPRPLPRPRS